MYTGISIRTRVFKDDRVYLQAGAGIVADSVPEAEFQETENKVGALREALRLASRDLKPAGADETTAPAKSHRQDAVHQAASVTTNLAYHHAERRDTQ